jgi:hypothetical protein
MVIVLIVIAATTRSGNGFNVGLGDAMNGFLVQDQVSR